MPSRSSRRTYNRVVATEDDTTTNDIVNIESSNALDEPLSPSQDENNTNNNNSTSILTSKLDDDTNQLVSVPPIYNGINIILMDSTQSKFNIKCDATWTISQFKEVSSIITKVPKQSQRLICMGKLLKDDMTLNEYGINESDKIIHLFPKPNVVVNNSSSTTDNNSGIDNDNAESPEGAHIPQIILDEDEANRRSQILILSSQEIFEAQHRVKIFSFLLMIISSMELLTLMTLFLSVQTEEESNSPYGGGGDTTTLPPGNPTDTPPSSGGGGNGNMQMRVWQNSDYFDTVISSFGFYVSLLGIRATTENTLQLAKRYFICVTIAGVLSNWYYYYLNIQATSKQASNRNQHLDPTELYTTSFVQILLPLTVWLLCIIRAHQFQVLIREAEVEAEERARGLNNNDGDGNVGESSGGNIEGQGEEEVDAPRILQYGSDDLELAVERGVSS